MDAAKLMSLMKAKKATLKKVEKTIKPAPGDNRYVILPGWRKEESHVWFHDYGQHFVKNMVGELQAVYLCTDKTFGTPCDVCSGLSSAIRATSDDETVKALKEASASQGYLMNALALDSSEPNVPQILQLGRMAYANLVEIVENWGVNVLDSVEPMIVTINRSGKGLTTKYVVQISPKKHVLPAGVLEKLNNLDEYVAQENEEAKRRAIMAINGVAGLALPQGDRPRQLSGSSPFDSDADDAALSALATGPKVVSKPAGAAAANIALDDELEALLAGAA